jgi:hypothetical protein
MPAGSQRRADLRLILGATVGVLLGGLIIAAAVFNLTAGGGVPSVNEPLAFGLASDIRQKVREGGPINFADPTGGGNDFWVGLEDGRLVPLLVSQPKPADCTLRWRGSLDTFTCDGEPVQAENLARYRSFIQRSGDTKGLYMVEIQKVLPPPDGPPAA